MDQAKLKSYLANDAITKLHVFSEIDSTNSEADRLISAGATGIQLVVADSQSAGRGRRGRNWLSPIGSGVYLSLLYPFSIDVSALQGLSLVSAISVHTAIHNYGAENVQLKWPNDVLVGDKKLSGILLELRSFADENWVVFGIGVNYRLSEEQKSLVDRPVTDLHEILPDPPSIERVAADITNRLLQNISKHSESQFSTFQTAWNRYDRYLDTDVMIQNGNQQLLGRYKGVNEHGALLLQTGDEMQQISGGEVFPSLIAVSD